MNAFDGHSRVVSSPVGPLTLTAERGALVAIGFGGPVDGADGVPRPGLTDDGQAHDPILAEAERQLSAYFAGELRAFDLPLRPGGTPFQLAVWEALQRIPYGATAAYGELARSLGRPGAARAVGGANHRNPIAIVIPCHRVIGAHGGLTGYAGGLDIKAALLELEARRSNI